MKLDIYLNNIKDTTDKLGVGTYAFRGQGNAQWPLHSAATRRLRKHRGEGIQNRADFLSLYLDYHISTLIAPARTQGLGIELGREISDLQLLAKLQHLKAATGLLDFSWNPLVGLWFACTEFGADGKVFALNTNDPIRVGVISSDESRQSVSSIFSPSGEFASVAYWEPMVSGDAAARILRQRSVFIIGRPLIPEGGNIVGEIIIARDDKEDLIRELALLDITQRSLFLDAHGFAEANSVGDAVSLSQDDYLVGGNRYYQQGEYLYAIEAYGKFIELNPDSYTIYFLRGNAHAELHNHARALEDYDKAIGTMNKSVQSIRIDHMIYFNRANSKAELGDNEGALQDYRRAIDLAPDPEQYQYNMANAYADMFRFDEAISAYEKVPSPGWRLIFNKGNALMCLGRFAEAYECYIQAAAQAPDNGTIHQNLWTSSRLLNMLGSMKYTQSLTESGAVGIHLQVFVAEKESYPELHQHTYMIAGRVGNAGNFGFMNPGGQGFTGRGNVTIGISSRHVDQE